MRRLATALALSAMVALLAMPAFALTLTGSRTDFPPTALIGDDSGDTEAFDCGAGPVEPLDIKDVWCLVQDDTLYIGVGFDRFCFCDIQLGIALHTRPGGTATDPFNRQIIWSGLELPDYLVYDVIPTVCSDFNYEVIYESDGAGGWVSLGDGPDFWGFFDVDGGDFKEFCIPLGVLGIDPLSPISFEVWVTQDDFGSGLKPAFDFFVNDSYPDDQKSTPGGPTLFDVPDGEESTPEEFYTKEAPVPTEPATWGQIKVRFNN